jgi:type I restriction enzyme S subunit
MKWEKVSLEGISTRIGDGLHGTPKYDDSGEFYFINGNNLSEGKIFIKEDTKRISSIEYDKIKKDLSEKTVLVAINGTLGNVGLYRDEPVALGKSACYINVNEKAEKLFVRYVLENDDFQRYARDFATGSTIKNLGLKAVRDYSFNLPPLPTQSKIASILTAYDDLIENNLKRIKLLEEKAFLRYKQIVREEKMDEFLIEEVCETLGGGTPATGDRRFWDEGDILWFSPTDLTKHHSIVLLNSEKKITELGLQKSSAKLVPPKTILMTSRASIGYFGLINKSASTNQGFINIIPFNENHRAYMLFDLKNRKEEIIGNANGSTFLEISKGKFRQMKMKLPKDEKILEDFEREFEINFNFIENLLKQNNKLREARDILLPKLMNGQIEV